MKKDQDFAFKDLLVWHKAMDITDSVLSVTETLPAPLSLPPSPACAGFGRAGLKERPTAQFSNMQINLSEKSVIARGVPL